MIRLRQEHQISRRHPRYMLFLRYHEYLSKFAPGYSVTQLIRFAEDRPHAKIDVYLQSLGSNVPSKYKEFQKKVKEMILNNSQGDNSN
jgi:hypothetical protein